ncbi:MAG: hypothetical protein R2815_05320 [Flavobacteriales bacterium]|nr:hypothetical protein [Flavobacteriales bacterium]
MKTLITLVAFAGLLTSASAQSTAKDAPRKVDAQKVDKISCEGKAQGACCAGKTHASATGTEATKEAAKMPSCCAAMASTGKGCDHAHAAAGHEHGALNAHACTDACKEGAHAYTCGEEGHTCSTDCHGKM